MVIKGKRWQWIHVRVSEEEKRAISEKARRAGKADSTYVRDHALGEDVIHNNPPQKPKKR